MSEEELRERAAKKVQNIFSDAGIDMPLEKILEHTTSFACYKVTVSFSFSDDERIKEKINILYNCFNCEVDYLTEYVDFSFKASELDDSSAEEENKIRDVIDKINKLLNVTEERGATEAEAVAAALKAQSLMKKYSLDYENIKVVDDEEICEVKAGTYAGGRKWKYGFAHSVATAFRCKSYHDSISVDTIVFRGFKSDILIARRVFKYLYDTCIRLAKQEQEEYDKKNRTRNKFTSFYRSFTRKKQEHEVEDAFNSFCIGFADGVAERLSINCKALALTTPQKVEEDWKIWSISYTSKTEDVWVDSQCFRRGEHEGKKAVDGQYLPTDAKERSLLGKLLIGTNLN